jgi:hypothetical protein
MAISLAHGSASVNGHGWAPSSARDDVMIETARAPASGRCHCMMPRRPNVQWQHAVLSRRRAAPAERAQGEPFGPWPALCESTGECGARLRQRGYRAPAACSTFTLEAFVKIRPRLVSALVVPMMCTAGPALAGNSGHGHQSDLTLSAAADTDAQSFLFTITQPKAKKVRLACDEVCAPESPSCAPERLFVRGRAAKSQTITLRGFKAGTTYRCVAEKNASAQHRSNEVTVNVAPLPPDLLEILPRVSVPSADVAGTGYTLFNVGNVYDALLGQGATPDHQFLVILDAEGNVRWHLGGVGAADIDATWLGGDQILYGGGTLRGFVPPTILGLDKQATFVATSAPASPYELYYNPALPTQLGPFDPSHGFSIDSYNHDVGLSADGASIYTLAHTVNPTTCTAQGCQLGFVIKQIDRATNTVVWGWDSTLHGLAPSPIVDIAAAFHGALGEPSPYAFDPLHANAVWDLNETDASGAPHPYLFVSMRNSSQVVKIDRETGAVVWRIGLGGDFDLHDAEGNLLCDHADPTRCDPSAWFFNQHDAKVHQHPGSLELTAYDDGADSRFFAAPPYLPRSTRVLRLALDESTMTARYTFTFTQQTPDGIWGEPFWGGYDDLPNGNSLVASGHCGFAPCPPNGYVDTPMGPVSIERQQSSLMEVTPQGTIAWRADFPAIPEPSPGMPTTSHTMVYRADHIDGCAFSANLTYCPELDSQACEDD